MNLLKNLETEKGNIMEAKGYILLHRKILDNIVFSNMELFRFFIWCLFRANFKDGFYEYFNGHGMSSVECKRGEFITGQFSGSKEVNMSPAKFRNNLKKLKKYGLIEIEPSTKFTKIKILKYSNYQTVINSDDKQSKNKVKTKYKQSKNKVKTKHNQSATSNKELIMNKEELIMNNKEEERLFENDDLFSLDNFKKAFKDTDYEFCNLEYYYNAVWNWSASKSIKRNDWKAVASSFMLRDLKDNKLVKNETSDISERNKKLLEW